MRSESDMTPDERLAPARGLIVALAIQTALTAAAVVLSF